MINSSAGFTLIELLVVLLVIGVLMGVVVVVFNPQSVMTTSRQATLRANTARVCQVGVVCYGQTQSGAQCAIQVGTEVNFPSGVSVEPVNGNVEGTDSNGCIYSCSIMTGNISTNDPALCVIQ